MEVSGVSEVFAAACAKSFRNSFSAWATRIFATIAGLVLEGGGTGSGILLIATGFSATAIFGDVGRICCPFEGFVAAAGFTAVFVAAIGFADLDGTGIDFPVGFMAATLEFVDWPTLPAMFFVADFAA